MLEIVILHQIPFSPKAVDVSAIAIGIRAAVKIILEIDGGIVLPNHENAPAVVNSIHINNCDTPKIFK